MGALIKASYVYLLLVGHFLKGGVLWKSIGAVPYYKHECTDKRGRLIRLCAMMKILDVLGNPVSRSDIPRVHLFRDTSTTMELAWRELLQDGSSNFIHPQLDFGKEMQ
jgi:hypothetical protein